jgi:hypothetical protein
VVFDDVFTSETVVNKLKIVLLRFRSFQIGLNCYFVLFVKFGKL